MKLMAVFTLMIVIGSHQSYHGAQNMLAQVEPRQVITALVSTVSIDDLTTSGDSPVLGDDRLPGIPEVRVK